MEMDTIDVKVLKTVGAALTGDTLDIDSVMIDIFLNKETGDKYFSFTVLNGEPTTQIYTYPDVNPVVYELIDFIEKRGPMVVNTGYLYGPHLYKSREPKHYIGMVGDNDETFILKDDLVSKESKLNYEQLLKDIMDRS
jgi:hypothetical protein